MACAAQAIAALAGGRSLPSALDAAIGGHGLEAASHAAIRDIAYDTCRQLGLVRELARLLASRSPPPLLAALQWVALAQLLVPLRAEAVIVDQAVAAARLMPGGAAAAGFLNATLRRFVREREALLTAARRKDAARWNYPPWWIAQLRTEHPQAWRAMLEAGNTLPPMTLRVNRRHAAVDDYLAQLAAAGRGARRIGPQAVLLDEPCAVEALPGWAEGRVTVQDAGAQLAAPLLDPQPGERVLDACAAPGGKTTHLLELADCHVTALDLGEARLCRVRENLARLGFERPAVEPGRAGLPPRLLAGDARRPADWWDGEPFDRILVDAPCTASGIVRRHPDIRWLRRRSDLATLSGQQAEILAALWPLLRAGGKLLFATCSVFRAEGESVVDHFLASRRDARRLALFWPFDAGAAEPVSQLLPVATATRNHDGFFYALLEKRP
ncbi:MAG: 16S rRNA (cytosine(967)-C(5))-methyltransferase RsmB [Burkholderiaceae bacterium]|nr:16S rRNA (cytosine(967)-C(5))-methyltransferase RsmB [Burkholderiaceae bacterium]